jgi:hypothetical protein
LERKTESINNIQLIVKIGTDLDFDIYIVPINNNSATISVAMNQDAFPLKIFPTIWMILKSC